MLLLPAAWVFNAEQIDGIPPLAKKTVIASDWDPILRAEELVNVTEAKVFHNLGNRAFFNLVTDSIPCP
jgi:antirestriction protein ArdC